MISGSFTTMKANYTIICALLILSLVQTGTSSETKIAASDGNAQNNFGISLSVSNEDVLIGAPGNCSDGDNHGAVYHFRFDADISQWLEVGKIEAIDPDAFDMFGRSVSFFNDYAIIGARKDCVFNPNGGKVYLFHYDGAAWQQTARLTSSPYAGDDFGAAVAINDAYAAIGAPLGGVNLAGKVYVYKRVGADWTPDAIITPSDSRMMDYFGFSVALCDSALIVGAPGIDLFHVNPKGGGVGLAYIFQRVDGVWQETARFLPADATANNNFGCSVDIDGDYAVVGAGKDDVLDFDTGAVYVYRNDELDGWINEIKLTPLDADSGDYFGSSVSLSGKYLVVGAPGVDGLGENSGAVYSFLLSEEGWTQKTKTSAGDASENDQFGAAVSISEKLTVVGAPYKAIAGAEMQGAAYIYDNIDDLALPVELSYFSAVDQDGDVVLSWQTQSELDNIGFIIERRDIDGEWEVIASFQTHPELRGRGSATFPSEYTFIDEDVKPGVYQYRLADVNITGRVTYHAAVGVAVSTSVSALKTHLPNGAMLYPAFPNPFNSQTVISYQLVKSEFVDLGVFDMRGRRVATLVSEMNSPGRHRVQWDAEGGLLGSGVYFIRLQTERDRKMIKVFLVR